jgi:hypothetical protein
MQLVVAGSALIASVRIGLDIESQCIFDAEPWWVATPICDHGFPVVTSVGLVLAVSALVVTVRRAGPNSPITEALSGAWKMLLVIVALFVVDFFVETLVPYVWRGVRTGTSPGSTGLLNAVALMAALYLGGMLPYEKHAERSRHEEELREAQKGVPRRGQQRGIFS